MSQVMRDLIGQGTCRENCFKLVPVSLSTRSICMLTRYLSKYIIVETRDLGKGKQIIKCKCETLVDVK